MLINMAVISVNVVNKIRKKRRTKNMQDNYVLYLKEQKLIHLSLKINEKLGKILVVRKGTKIQKITPLKRS